MSRILALGVGPLLGGNVRHVSAHGLRTWHLVKPLLDDGHEVLLYTIPIMTDDPSAQIESGVEEREQDGFKYRALRNHDEAVNLRLLAEAAAEFKPDAMLGINSAPCALLPKLDLNIPFWADLNGSVLIEGEVKSAVYGHNAWLGRYWDAEAAPLRRADRFSTVSTRQIYMLHGELAMVGRLNSHTFNYTFADCIPNAFNPAYATLTGREAERRPLRGHEVPHGSFIILWSGGYNSWMDVELLVGAVEDAMENCPGLHYVSTGGAIHGHDDLTYPKFEARVAASRHAARFHLLGWIPADEVAAVWAQADLGLCVDAPNHETMFGARNRTINMMAAGLPVLTTLGAEISDELAQAGVVIPSPMGNAPELTRAMMKAYRQGPLLRQFGAKGRRYVLENFTYEGTTGALREWMRAPTFAPDNVIGLDRKSRVKGCDRSNPIKRRLANTGCHSAAETRAQEGNYVGEIGSGAGVRLRTIERHIKLLGWPRYRSLSANIKAGAPLIRRLMIDLDVVSGGGQRLTPAELSQIIRTLPAGLCRIEITGPEPAALPQFEEFCLGIIEASPDYWGLWIHTSGALPFGLPNMVARLGENKAPVVGVIAHVDAVGPALNELRRSANAWAELLETLETLEAMSSENGRIVFEAFTEIRASNQNDLEAIAQYVRDHYHVRHRFELRSGAPPDVLARREIMQALRRIHFAADQKNPANLAAARASLRGNSGLLAVPSIAPGNLAAVLRADGSLAACHCSEPFANLRDFDFDFTAAWNSPAAKAMRADSHRCKSNPPCFLELSVQASFRGFLEQIRAVL